MSHFNYLMVGGGMTADAAVGGIRAVDGEGSIGLISAEGCGPYDRPPLSKKLWQGKAEDSIWRHTAEQGVSLHLSRTVQKLDVAGKVVVDDRGEVYSYDKLLLATGGRPRRLAGPDEGVLYFRTYEDYQALRQGTGDGKRFAVLGGGFIGSELAAALARNGQQVVMLFPERGIGARLFPADHSLFLNEYYREQGVEVAPETLVEAVARRGDKLLVRTARGRELEVDGVVAGLGIVPNVELAQAAGLKTGDGIEVDRFLGTSAPDVYAAGDVASFYAPALQRRMRVEHEDNANTMGRMAGLNMAGEATPYEHLPFYYSDLFDLGYEAVGVLDSRLETVVDWQEPHRKGVIYYLDGGHVQGVLLWNVWGQVEEARQAIGDRYVVSGD